MKIPIPLDRSQPMIDTADEYNRHLRAHRRKRGLAIIGSALFLALLGIALGKLSYDDGNLFFIPAITAWGVWGFHHLITRHK